MSGFARLQLIGPALLFAALLGADGAAYALAMFPSWSFLWRLNLDWFGIFQKADYVLSGYVDVAYFQLLFIGLPLIVMAGCGFICRRRLMLAIASNLSFVYASFLILSWYINEQSWKQTSLQAASFQLVVPEGPDLGIIGALLGASLLSLIVSHMSYLRAVRADRDANSGVSASTPSDRRRGAAAESRVD